MLTGGDAVYLEGTQKDQLYHNYCGPATVFSVVSSLKNEGVTDTTLSQYPGDETLTLTQPHAAGANYTDVDGNGETDWGVSKSSNYLSRALNRWFFGGNGDNAWYEPEHPTSLSGMEDHISFDIDASHMPAAWTIETASTVHYNNHPTTITIRHIWSIQGYIGSDAATLMGQDPAQGQPGYEQSLDYFQVTAQRAYNLMRYEINDVADRGIVW